MLRIKFHRIALGLSQRDLARLARIQQSIISQIESGRIVPTAEELDKLGHVLRCTPARLLDRLDDTSITAAQEA